MQKSKERVTDDLSHLEYQSRDFTGEGLESEANFKSILAPGSVCHSSKGKWLLLFCFQNCTKCLSLADSKAGTLLVGILKEQTISWAPLGEKNAYCGPDTILSVFHVWTKLILEPSYKVCSVIIFPIEAQRSNHTAKVTRFVSGRIGFKSPGSLGLESVLLTLILVVLNLELF